MCDKKEREREIVMTVFGVWSCVTFCMYEYGSFFSSFSFKDEWTEKEER